MVATPTPAKRPPPPVQVIADDLCPRGHALTVCGWRPPARETAIALRLIGQCLVRWQAKAAGPLVAEAYDPQRAPPALARLIADAPRCAPERRMRVSGVLLAGAVADLP